MTRDSLLRRECVATVLTYDLFQGSAPEGCAPFVKKVDDENWPGWEVSCMLHSYPKCLINLLVSMLAQ